MRVRQSRGTEMGLLFLLFILFNCSDVVRVTVIIKIGLDALVAVQGVSALMGQMKKG